MGMHQRYLLPTIFLTSTPLQVGSAVGGRLADRAVIKGRLRRDGKWVPEDRLRVTLYGALILLPLDLLVFGLTVRFVPGKVGLVVCLVCLFVNGAGVRARFFPAISCLSVFGFKLIPINK